ncbi:MAG: hypothetical protein NTV34_22095 [Proteobacteria bacterium]|nr:hypothetical protein [Pseudomonadota bacterium]
MAFRQGRELISRALGNKPGGLGELMIWDAASRNNEFLEYVNDERWTAKLGFASCLTIPYAAPRWFTVAQVAANLPGHPVVQTLDPDKLSYYNYRTPPDSWLGCPSVVISEEAHWPGVLATQSLVVIDQQRFVFPSVLDRPIIVARVVGKASDRSR